MSISAGKLRHRVEIQHQAYTQNQDTGEMVTTWTKLATVWASVEPVSGREYLQSQATQAEVTARITIRYRSDVKPDMRIKFLNEIYNIHPVLPDNNSGLEYLTLMCSKGVGDGG